jgi:hypothetical protein
MSLTNEQREHHRQLLAEYKRANPHPSPHPRPVFLRNAPAALLCVHNQGKDTSAACGGCGGSRTFVCAVHDRVQLSRCMNCEQYEKK